MGCDIHGPHVEQLGDEAGRKWRHIACMTLDRYYGTFSAMAGVRERDTHPPLYQPRGIPGDLSWETGWAYNEGQEDWHSASWLTTDEVEKVVKSFDEPPHNLVATLKLMREIETDDAPCRIVFWFDN